MYYFTVLSPQHPDQSILLNPDSSVFRIRIGQMRIHNQLFTSLHIPIQIRKQRTKAMRISILIQILVRLCRHKKFDFDKVNILYLGNMS